MFQCVILAQSSLHADIVATQFRRPSEMKLCRMCPFVHSLERSHLWDFSEQLTISITY